MKAFFLKTSLGKKPVFGLDNLVLTGVMTRASRQMLVR